MTSKNKHIAKTALSVTRDKGRSRHSSIHVCSITDLTKTPFIAIFLSKTSDH